MGIVADFRMWQPIVWSGEGAETPQERPSETQEDSGAEQKPKGLREDPGASEEGEGDSGRG